jgi:hypothetical protein
MKPRRSEASLSRGSKRACHEESEEDDRLKNNYLKNFKQTLHSHDLTDMVGAPGLSPQSSAVAQHHTSPTTRVSVATIAAFEVKCQLARSAAASVTQREPPSTHTPSAMLHR